MAEARDLVETIAKLVAGGLSDLQWAASSDVFRGGFRNRARRIVELVLAENSEILRLRSHEQNVKKLVEAVESAPDVPAGLLTCDDGFEQRVRAWFMTYQDWQFGPQTDALLPFQKEKGDSDA